MALDLDVAQKAADRLLLRDTFILPLEYEAMLYGASVSVTAAGCSHCHRITELVMAVTFPAAAAAASAEVEDLCGSQGEWKHHCLQHQCLQRLVY
jgi:hypothetical protein